MARKQLSIKDEIIALLPRLRRFARNLTRSDVDADDVVQEACLRALARAELWNRDQPLDRWVFRIARNCWISELRRRKVRMGADPQSDGEIDDIRTEITGESDAIARDLHGEINALPPDLASVLLVVSVEGYSYAEAAALFHIPKGTVMSRLYRARKLLFARLQEQNMLGQGI